MIFCIKSKTSPSHALNVYVGSLDYKRGPLYLGASHAEQGWTASSIGEEKRFNPHLAGTTQAQYVELMNNLPLPHTKMMDIAFACESFLRPAPRLVKICG